MSTDEIKENNSLIATFMGYEVMTEDDFLNKNYDVIKHNTIIDRSLVYEKNWNQLMEVVEKIEDFETIDVDIHISGTRIYQWRSGGLVIADNCANISFEKKIEHTYDAVVTFIKWYNKNTNSL